MHHGLLLVTMASPLRAAGGLCWVVGRCPGHAVLLVRPLALSLAPLAHGACGCGWTGAGESWPAARIEAVEHLRRARALPEDELALLALAGAPAWPWPGAPPRNWQNRLDSALLSV